MIRHIPVYKISSLFLLLSSTVYAAESVNAVKLTYQEQEQGVDPYVVTYTMSSEFLRIDDEVDNSGYIIYDLKQNRIYSISHYDQSILVVPQYPEKEFKPGFDLDIEYKLLENAPMISQKKVYNYRVNAVTKVSSETCMDIQLVPGLLPEVTKSLQSFQKIISAQHTLNLEQTPEEFKTPCYLVDQVYNKGDYYSKGLPIQEWHSNDKRRQLMNFENTEVDAAIFDMPQEYRQYSLK